MNKATALCSDCGTPGLVAWGRCYDCAHPILVRYWAWAATILLGAFFLVLAFILLSSGFGAWPGPGPFGWGS